MRRRFAGGRAIEPSRKGKRPNMRKTAGTRKRKISKTPAKVPKKKAPAIAKKSAPSPALALAEMAVAALEAKQGHDPVVLDIRGKSSFADYFVLVSGHNPPHLHAMSEEVHHHLKKNGVVCYRRAGGPESGWLVLDYVDVVIHILLDEQRRYYAIEDLWRARQQE